MSFKGYETAFRFSSDGMILSGIVFHGGHLDRFGPLEPEVIIEKVIDEDSGAETNFDVWLSGHPRQGMGQRKMVAAMEEAVIERVVKPRDPEDEEACRGDYERDMHKDPDWGKEH